MGALREEVDELSRATDPVNAAEEVGDVLFATVAVAGRLGVDAESALRRTIAGFAERYERFTRTMAERGLELDSMSEADVRALFRQSR
jgi:ATP diphosphatase